MSHTVTIEQQSSYATLMVQNTEWLRFNLAEYSEELKSQITDVVVAALVAQEQIEGLPKSYEHTTFTTALWRLHCALHDIAYEGEDVPIERDPPDATWDDVEGVL